METGFRKNLETRGEIGNLVWWKALVPWLHDPVICAVITYQKVAYVQTRYFDVEIPQVASNLVSLEKHVRSTGQHTFFWKPVLVGRTRTWPRVLPVLSHPPLHPAARPVMNKLCGNVAVRRDRLCLVGPGLAFISRGTGFKLTIQKRILKWPSYTGMDFYRDWLQFWWCQQAAMSQVSTKLMRVVDQQLRRWEWVVKVMVPSLNLSNTDGS